VNGIRVNRTHVNGIPGNWIHVIRFRASPPKLRENIAASFPKPMEHGEMRAVPWKSGASAPRKPAESPRASAPGVVLPQHIAFSRGPSAPPPPTWFQNGKPDAASSRFRNPRLLYHMWKKSPQTRTKPVIAGDTTYGVSLLTGTICGSNFAIPSNEFRLTGMGRNLQESNRNKTQSGNNVGNAKPEVTWPPHGKLKRKAQPSPSWPGLSSRKPEAGSRVLCGGRPPTLPGARQVIEN
jgi:hypothetical protein